MRQLDLNQATESLAGYVEQLGDDQLVIIQDGQPVAVLMPVTEDELEDINLGQNPEFLAILEKSRTSLQDKGGRTLEQVKQRLGLVP
jgi:hypothetical protein